MNLLLQLWAAKLPASQVLLNLPLAEVDQIVEDAANFDYIIGYTTEFRTESNAYYEFKDSMFNGEPGAVMATPAVAPFASPFPLKPGIINRVEAMRQKIYSASDLTDELGLELDVYMPEGGEPDTESLIAALVIGARPNGVVRIQFSKQGMGAMRIQYKGPGDTEWQLVGDFSTSPALHNKPSDQPESRVYRGILLEKDQPVGNYSPIYTVVTTP